MFLDEFASSRTATTGDRRYRSFVAVDQTKYMRSTGRIVVHKQYIVQVLASIHIVVDLERSQCWNAKGNKPRTEDASKRSSKRRIPVVNSESNELRELPPYVPPQLAVARLHVAAAPLAHRTRLLRVHHH